MAEKSGFFNSDQGDRTYAADFFAEYFASFIGNGVYPNPSTACQVIASGNMTVALSAGQGWINGYYYHNTDNLILNLDIADGVLKRIDRIVLRYTVLNREIRAYVKKGTFASTPVAPALQRDADVWELGVADIFIGNGVVSVNQANITDLRLNNTYCGIVHGVIDQVDTTTIFNQFQAWYLETVDDATTDIATMLSAFQSSFNAWFANLQDTLDENTAANLLNKINDLIDKMTAAETAIALKVDKSDYIKSPGYGTSTGSVNTYAVTLDPSPTNYFIGMCVVVKINIQNTGASTININGLGAKSILDSKGNAMAAGKLKANIPYTMRYNGTNFILQGEGASGDATASDLYSGKTASVDAGDIVGTSPYKSGVILSGKSVGTSMFPVETFSNYNIQNAVFGYDKWEDVWYEMRASDTTHNQLFKFAHVEGSNYKYSYVGIITLSSSGTNGLTGAIEVTEDTIYVSAGSKLYRINKTTFTAIDSVICSDYQIIEVRRSVNTEYLIVHARMSNSYIYIYKVSLTLTILGTVNTALGYNYVFMGLDRRHVVTTTGWTLDTLDMSVLTEDGLKMTAINGAYDNHFQRKSFWMGTDFFLSAYGLGRFYKHTPIYDGNGHLTGLTYVGVVTFTTASGNEMYFPYSDNLIYVQSSPSTTLVLGDVLINADTLAIEGYCPEICTFNCKTSPSRYDEDFGGFFGMEYISYNSTYAITGRRYTIKPKFILP